jgi:translation initiation factor IF-2
MRVRGSQCTDLIVLVVAADDGIKPQTIEAINHAKAAKVPILVAINKIDKPNLDMKRIKNQLSQHDLLPEEWGGDVIFVNISAKYGTNIDKLLESILLQSDLLELKAYHEGPAEGVVVESKVEKGRGVVATLLVKNGRLRKGDFILAGQEYGKVRLLKDESMNELKYATPSMPVEVLGLSSAPLAGNKFIVLEDEVKAREIANDRKQKNREIKFYSENKNNISNMLDSMKDNKIVLPIILKTDVQGSAEAIKESLYKLSNDKIKILIVSSGIGEINESDVNLTIASKGILVAFNVKADAKSRKLAQLENIKLNYYNIIYDLINGIEKILSGKTKVSSIEKIIGIVEVKDIFKNSKTGIIVGCKVIEGFIKKGESIRILRDDNIIYKGTLESLRRFKDNIQEVKSGNECGISLKNFNDIKQGDRIEVFTKEKPKKV